MKPVRINVVIGRFQPVHRAHVALLREAAKDCDRLLVLLGSAHRARSVVNPWTWEERQHMLSLALPDVAHVRYVPIRDYLYDDEMWKLRALHAVRNVVAGEFPGQPYEATVVGVGKDARTAWYLGLFDGARMIDPAFFEPMDATRIRASYLTNFSAAPLWSQLVAPEIIPYLKQWLDTETYVTMTREYDAVSVDTVDVNRLRRWRPKFCADATVMATVDAIPHVLMVRRKGPVGAGNYALPGGHVEPDEDSVAAAIRECCEETGLDVASERRVTSRLFDHPRRATNGRVITNASLFRITPAGTLPTVKGKDDAGWAGWLPLREVYGLESRIFDDHLQIIHYLTSPYTGMELP